MGTHSSLLQILTSVLRQPLLFPRSLPFPVVWEPLLSCQLSLVFQVLWYSRMYEGISFPLEEAKLRSSGHLIRSERGVEASAESVHPILPQIHCSSHFLKCCVKRLFRHRSVEFQLLHMILDVFSRTD